MAVPDVARQAQNQSTADLLRQLSTQTTQLVRDELQLAKVELSQKGKQAGIGAGMFGAAGVIALFGVGALVAAAIAALALAMATWLAAVIVGVVLLAVAGVAALMGRSRVQRAVPPAPQQTVQSVKADVDTVKHSAQRGRQHT